MGKREIKKTVVRYGQSEPPIEATHRNEKLTDRERSRQKEGIHGTHKDQQVKVEQTDLNSRRARLQAMRRARQQEQEALLQQDHQLQDISVKIEEPLIAKQPQRSLADQQKMNFSTHKPVNQTEEMRNQQKQEQSEGSEGEEVEQEKVIRKPIFIAREYRDQENDEDLIKQQERKKKNMRYTTKMLLEQQRYEDSEEENELTDSQDQNNPNAIDDDDTADEELQFELWKIRELNRIRRALEERRKYEVEKAQIERRRQMTNEAILLENKALGSDATSGDTQTKYTYMQKYYHKGAFYQDSEDQIFKRDYNLPTPMEMQDKTLLPAILQKRVGNFGKKGQSKYTHLTAEDTSDLNPLTRPDESLLEYWKRRTAGYKGSSSKNL